MGIMRGLLLAGSESVWLREKAMRWPFVRRSVSRFMPGDRVEDALAAAGRLKEQGAATIFTQLGENVRSADEAEAVTGHYLDVLDKIAGAGLDTQISVKPTQLGLDQSAETCFANLMRLVERAEAKGNLVWIDMEQSSYVDPTLDLYRRARKASKRVGVCLQSYLRRTAADLEGLIPLGPAIRLVKGAYREPPERAFPRKSDVDESFYRLAARMLGEPARTAGSLLGVATHDPRLIARLQTLIADTDAPREAYEFEMLFGIQRRLQGRLLQEGRRLRVLISYGEYWFPWYMRRLAERPANVWFVVRNLFAR
jgi:proline dehydrogenase